MVGDLSKIDSYLVRALRGEPIPFNLPIKAHLQLGKRVAYHGVGGILLASPNIANEWPSNLIADMRQEAIGRARWELRHREILTDLISDFTDRGIKTLFLKGTALAYAVYKNPSERFRGDTDLLIDPGDYISSVRTLTENGFQPGNSTPVGPGPGRLQETWYREVPDGSKHHIDLHWQVMNSPSLAGCLPLRTCFAVAEKLPELSDDAFWLGPSNALIHACLHRAMNSVSPYFVDGKGFTGEERFLWLVDIDKLVRSLNDRQREAFCKAAGEQGIGPICLDALVTANRLLGTPLPEDSYSLAECLGDGRAIQYLVKAGRRARTAQDFWAITGWRPRLRFAYTKLFPPTESLRPGSGGVSSFLLALLYVKRIADWLRGRPSGQS